MNLNEIINTATDFKQVLNESTHFRKLVARSMFEADSIKLINGKKFPRTRAAELGCMARENGKLIPAIKLLREEAGSPTLGLKDTKDTIEKWMNGEF